MSGNATVQYSDTAIVAVADVEAPEVVTSDEIDAQLAETYERIGTRPGLLEGLAGIRERRWWPEGHRFTDAAIAAGERAIASSGVDPDDIGLLIDTSVCRDRLEPSSAVTVHDGLGLSSWCTNFDLGNACLGFMNAAQIAGNMIEAGQIRYALVVDGEGSRETQQRTLRRLTSPMATKADFANEFATLTLGSGGAAVVLGRHSENPGSHKLIKGISRADTSHHRLCVGTIDGMHTDTKGLLVAGLHLWKLAWGDLGGSDWLEIDRYILHQISQVHTTKFCEMIGIDIGKVPLTFPFLGNTGPASIPITLSREAAALSAGDRVLLMGVGSGLNVSALEVVW